MEILTTVPVYTYPFPYVLLFSIAVTVAIIGFMTCISIVVKEPSWGTCLFALILLVLGAIGIKSSLKSMYEHEVFEYNKYKVTLDETISAREFLDKYEIADERGKILTVIEDVN